MEGKLFISFLCRVPPAQSGFDVFFVEGGGGATFTLNSILFANVTTHHRYKCPKCRAPFCCVQCSKDHRANSCPAAGGGAAVPPPPPAGGAVDADAATSDDRPPPRRKRRVRKADDDDDSHDDEPGWNVTTEMKERVRRSAWMQDELRDGGLRSLIERIDDASEDDDDDGGGGDNDGTNGRGRGGGVGGGHQGGDRRGGRNDGADRSTAISAREVALERTRRSHPKFASFVDRMLLEAEVLVREQAASSDDPGDHPGHHLVLAPVPRRITTSGAVECVNVGNGDGGGSDNDDVEEDSDDSGGGGDDDDSDEESDSSASSEGMR